MAETVAINPQKILGTTRYNGGWIKSVAGLDKTKANGYSILGEFMRQGADIYTLGGVYLDCGIGGSRKNQWKTYTLFRVNAADDLEVLATAEGRDWATDLWPAIDAALNVPEKHPLEDFTLEELRAEIERREGANTPGAALPGMTSSLASQPA